MNARAHILVLLMTVSSLGFMLRLLRRHELQTKYALLWLSIGGLLVVLAISPALLERVSGWVGIYYAPATFFLGAITLLFFVVLHLTWEVSRLEERTRTLAEELAIARVHDQSSDGGDADKSVEG